MGDMADMTNDRHWCDDDDDWGEEDGCYAPHQVDTVLSDCILVQESFKAWLIEHPAIVGEIIGNGSRKADANSMRKRKGLLYLTGSFCEKA